MIYTQREITQYFNSINYQIKKYGGILSIHDPKTGWMTVLRDRPIYLGIAIQWIFLENRQVHSKTGWKQAYSQLRIFTQNNRRNDKNKNHE